jgi:hypothetical protein
VTSRPDPRSGLDADGKWTPAFEGQRPPDELRPARGYSWPAFEPGNSIAVRHGVYVKPRLRPEHSAEVDEILAAILEAQPPEFRGPRFDLAREMFACRVWQARRAYADLAEHGLLRGEERLPAPILRYLGTLERTLQRDMAELGLTPRSMTELGLDMARTGDALRAHLEERYGTADQHDTT